MMHVYPLANKENHTHEEPHETPHLHFFRTRNGDQVRLSVSQSPLTTDPKPIMVSPKASAHARSSREDPINNDSGTEFLFAGGFFNGDPDYHFLLDVGAPCCSPPSARIEDLWKYAYRGARAA
jgi:hypothetical protein